MLNAAVNNGLRVYENSEVVNIKYDEDQVCAETVYGHKVKGKIIIAATGYNTKLFSDRQFGTKTTAFNVATEPIKNLEEVLKNTVIRYNEDPYDYFRTTNDERIIIGGEDINFDPDIENKELCEKMYYNLEQKLKNLFKSKNIKIEYKYCGCFASTVDNLGFIGKDPQNDKLWYCLGYGANGILFAILGGMMLSDLYYGKHNEDMKLFRVDRFSK